ncbi:MAG: hypothetical protein IPO58_26450 [Betaproteobacteria bacterium]|nr:hypothetical protein [Betaproteobacteria bacterium]
MLEHVLIGVETHRARANRQLAARFLEGILPELRLCNARRTNSFPNPASLGGARGIPRAFPAEG